MAVDLIEQFPVLIIFCIDNAQHRLKNAHIPQHLLRHIRKIKHEIHIADPVGPGLVEHSRHTGKCHLLVDDRRDLPGNIRPLQHGDLLNILRPVRLGLVVLQLFGLLHQALFPGIAEAVLESLQLLLQLPVHPGRAALLRLHHDNGPVSVVQQVFPDQLLIVSCSHLTFQERKCIQGINVHKWLVFIVEPAVHHLQPIHKSLGIAAEVRLPVSELMIVDPRLQGFLVYTFVRRICQHLFDDADKFLFLLHVGIFGNNREDGLVNAVVVGSYNILPDACICQGFLQGCARRGQKRVVQDLECQIQLFVQAGADHFIVREVGVVLLRLIACDGVGDLLFHHPVKRLLQTDG